METPLTHGRAPLPAIPREILKSHRPRASSSISFPQACAKGCFQTDSAHGAYPNDDPRLLTSTTDRPTADVREGQCAPQEASPRGTASYCHRPQPRLIRGQVPGAARSLAPLALTSRGRYPLLLIGTGGPHSVTATGRTPSPPRVGANEEPVARRRLTGIEQSRVLPGEQSSRIVADAS